VTPSDGGTDRYWQPPPRSTSTGHRIPRRPGYRPVQTRSLGFWAILAELPMRRLAKAMADEPDSRRYHQEEPNP